MTSRRTRWRFLAALAAVLAMGLVASWMWIGTRIPQSVFAGGHFAMSR